MWARRVASALTSVGVTRPRAGLQLGAHRGEWRTQLVRCVGQELALVIARCLQTPEHRVHRARQAGDLVVAARFTHPALQGRGRDVLDLEAHRLDRVAARALPGTRRRGRRRARPVGCRGAAPTTTCARCGEPRPTKPCRRRRSCRRRRRPERRRRSTSCAADSGDEDHLVGRARPVPGHDRDGLDRQRELAADRRTGVVEDADAGALIEGLSDDRAERHAVLDLVDGRPDGRRGSLFAVADQAVLDCPGQQHARRRSGPRPRGRWPAT